jgi:energy-coupling factor transport system permease protein
MALKDITIGRYVHGVSFAHRLDPRTKLFTLAILATALFSGQGLMSLVAATLVMATLSVSTGIGTSYLLRGLLPFKWLIAAALVLNVLFTGGHIVVEAPLPYGGLTSEGLTAGVLAGGRIALAVLLASLVTLTTEPVVLVDGVEKLLRPFERFGLHSRDTALAMVITIRFVPILIEEASFIRKSLEARGGRAERGLRRRLALVGYLFVPLFAAGIRRAEHLATAMDCRLYGTDGPRTRYHDIRFSRIDFIAAASAITCAIFIVSS